MQADLHNNYLFALVFVVQSVTLQLLGCAGCQQDLSWCICSPVVLCSILQTVNKLCSKQTCLSQHIMTKVTDTAHV